MRRYHARKSARLTAALAGPLLACLVCASAVRAELVEYYSYTVAQEGDTSVVVAAAFDTTAMVLRGEIQRSPLGGAVEISPLYHHGDGLITGSVAVSVTGGGGQYIVFRSHITLPPAFAPSHVDTVYASVDIPVTGQAVLNSTGVRQGFIETDFSIETTCGGDGEVQTVTKVTASTPLSEKTDLSLTNKTTTTEGGTSTDTYLKADVSLADGSITASITTKHETDEQGNAKASGEGGITFSGTNLELDLTAGVERSGAGPTKKVGGTIKYKPCDVLTLSLFFDFGFSDELMSGDVGLKLAYRPRSYLELFVGILYNIVESRTYGETGYGLSSRGSNADKRSPAEDLLAPAGPVFCGGLQSTYCCPDSTACADQPFLAKSIAAGSCLSCEATYRCAFRPSDPNSFVQSLTLSSVGGGGDKRRYEEALAVSGADEPPSASDDRAPGTYVSTSPNPFSRDTWITFDTATEGPVAVEIYDVSGRRVRDLASNTYPPGRNQVMWDGRDDRGEAVARGMYFVVLRGRAWKATGRALFLK